MKYGTWGKVIGGGLILAALCGAAYFGSKRTMNDEVKVPDQVDMWLGQSKADLEKNKGLPIEEDIQPAGATFRGFDYYSGSPKFPAVRFLHGKNTIVIPDVQAVDTFEDSQMDSSAPKGAQSINMTLKYLPFGGSHEQAREFMNTLFRSLYAAGWKRFIDFGSPRLKGASSWKGPNYDQYNLPPDVYSAGIDPQYQIPDKDKSTNDMTWWYFYANHVYLRVWLHNVRLKPEDPNFNTYMVSLKFETEWAYMNHIRKEASEEDAKNWRTKLWPAVLAERKQQRAKAEAVARKYGLEIDETYQDPIILPVDPTGNEASGVSGTTSKVGRPCPTTGMWYCDGVTAESGIYMRKGDPMPGQSYTKEQQTTMEWRLLKAIDDA